MGFSLVNVHNTHWQPTFHIVTFSEIWVDPELKKSWRHCWCPPSMKSISFTVPYGSHSTGHHWRSPSHCFKCYKNREREMTTNCTSVLEMMHLHLNTGIKIFPSTRSISPLVRIKAQSSGALTHRIRQNKRTIFLYSHRRNTAVAHVRHKNMECRIRVMDSELTRKIKSYWNCTVCVWEGYAFLQHYILIFIHQKYDSVFKIKSQMIWKEHWS